MLPRDGHAVHLVGDDGVAEGVNALLNRNAAAVVIAHLVVVTAHQAHVGRPRRQLRTPERHGVDVKPRSLEQVAHAHAGPSAVAYGARNPVRRAERRHVVFEIVEILAAVAVALYDAGDLDAGELGLEVVQSEGGGVEADAGHCEAVGGGNP